jgi:hypothetical protein
LAIPRREEIFEAVASLGEAGGVYSSVISERGMGRPVFVDVGGESINNDVAGDAWMGLQAQQESGVVIKPVDDFNICAVS